MGRRRRSALAEDQSRRNDPSDVGARVDLGYVDIDGKDIFDELYPEGEGQLPVGESNEHLVDVFDIIPTGKESACVQCSSLAGGKFSCLAAVDQRTQTFGGQRNEKYVHRGTSFRGRLKISAITITHRNILEKGKASI